MFRQEAGRLSTATFFSPYSDETSDEAPDEAPVIWSRVPETTLPSRQLYRASICENVVPVGRIKVDPA